MKDKKKNRSILIIFIVALAAMIPMFVLPYHSGHDTCFHVSNVMGLLNQIKANFGSPSMIVGNMAHEFGYGTRLFYPPLAHLVVAYMAYFIGDILVSFKITHFISLFLSGITMYCLSKRLSKNENISVMSAVIYMLFPYHISDIYIRDAIAESFLFIFIPMIISSIYELYYGDKRNFYPLFIFGYVGGMLSHLTMMVYFTVILVIYLIFKYKDTFKNIKYFITSAIFILLIASPFLTTLIEHKFWGDYSVFVPYHMAQDIQWSGLFPFSYINFFSDYGTSNIKYFMDIVTIIMLIVTIVNYKKIKKNKFYKAIIWFGLISFVLSLKVFPWDLLPVSLRIVQFPWRFETFVACSVSLIAPLCLGLLKKNAKKVLIISVVALVLFTYPNLRFANDNLVDFDNFWYDGGMGWQEEYLPTATANNKDYYNNRGDGIEVLNGTADVNLTDKRLPNVTFDITTDGATIEFPRLLYLGYKLTNEAGDEIEIKEDQYGFVSTRINESGTYTLKYTGTTAEKIFNDVSFLTIIFYLIWRLYEKNNCNSSVL